MYVSRELVNLALGSLKRRRILYETARDPEPTQNDAFFCQDRYYTEVHIQLLKIIVALAINYSFAIVV